VKQRLKKYLINKHYLNIFILFIAFFCFSFKAFAAEVLQVSSSSMLLIGDNNRTYTVKIACVEIRPEKENSAIQWLKKELPRHKKVNLQPKGSYDGILMAKVIPFKTNIDIAEKYINDGLAEDNC
tara:strand:+ start:3261 stop:3635 length:375 start_codon:yes stop_codon:yes gene_type:complete